MDGIKEQIAWLRAQHDKLALSGDTITGYSEAADTMEKLLAVLKASDAFLHVPETENCGDELEVLSKAVNAALYAAQTNQSLHGEGAGLTGTADQQTRVAPEDSCSGSTSDDGRHET